MAGAVLRGRAVGGRAFGYRSEPVTDETGRVVGARRVVGPVEAEVVRYIFGLYVDGLTPRAIAHRLNAEGVKPPRTAHGRPSGSWTPATIAGSTVRALGILNNPMYVGRDRPAPRCTFAHRSEAGTLNAIIVRNLDRAASGG